MRKLAATHLQEEISNGRRYSKSSKKRLIAFLFILLLITIRVALLLALPVCESHRLNESRMTHLTQLFYAFGRRLPAANLPFRQWERSQARETGKYRPLCSRPCRLSFCIDQWLRPGLPQPPPANSFSCSGILSGHDRW